MGSEGFYTSCAISSFCSCV
uniref:Uncharacterized protein n=1 Tax=Anguilla anguilla TaxID=7936 RepID=A0A0E9SPN7_ANGAN